MQSAFVTEVVGRVSVVRSDGRVEEVRNGDLLLEGDFLLTADGRIRIVFADGSNLAIVDGGQLLLRQVVYDAASNSGAITVAAAGGKFYFIPGTLGDQPATAILVETPAANIHPGRSSFAFQHTSMDGLGVSLIDASRSDSQPLVVDNDMGSAAIVDDRQRITVSGAGSAPVLVPELASAEPDSPAAEVSAGGDEGAFRAIRSSSPARRNSSTSHLRLRRCRGRIPALRCRSPRLSWRRSTMIFSSAVRRPGSRRTKDRQGQGLPLAGPSIAR